jgi:hypothetical protein
MARKLAVLSFKFPLVSKIEKMERGRRYRGGPGARYRGGPEAGDTGVVPEQ